MCMVMDNKNLVHHVIRNYFPQYVNTQEYEDIAQIGYMGLIKTVNKFDKSLNLQFSTYAVPMIWGEIKRHLREDRYVKIPRSFYEKVIALKNTIRKFIIANGLEPSLEELAQLQKVTREELAELMMYDKCLSYLEQPIDEINTLGDSLADEVDYYGKANLNMELQEALSHLPIEESKVFVMYHVEGLTQNEIADKLKINQVRVSRNLSRAKGKLQKELVSYAG